MSNLSGYGNRSCVNEADYTKLEKGKTSLGEGSFSIVQERNIGISNQLVIGGNYEENHRGHDCAGSVTSINTGGNERSDVSSREEETNAHGKDLGTNQRIDECMIGIDRYGFSMRKSVDEDDLESSRRGVLLSVAEIAQRKLKETERLNKWIKMMRRWNFTVKYRKEKLKRRIRKGVPDAVRGKVWMDLMYSEALKWRQSHPTQFLSANEVDQKILEDIEKDVDRTYPNHILFAYKDSSGQKSLRNVLTWYAALDPEIGYCQGMGFVAAMLLTYMTEEDAFYTLVAVLNRPAAPFRKMYSPDMLATQRFLDVFGDLGRMYLPSIFSKFDEEGMHQSMFLTEWVMTIFTRNFSFEFVTRVWDIFLNEDFKILYRICLGLLKSIETEILQADFESIMHTIRRIPQEVDIEEALEKCWSIPLQRGKINELNEAYDRKREYQKL